jgi:hypothetical protein
MEIFDWISGESIKKLNDMPFGFDGISKLLFDVEYNQM